MTSRKSAAEKIANHLGSDVDTIRDHRYQPTVYSTPVYILGDDRWAAGQRPPKDRYSEEVIPWVRVVSSYDNETLLWRYTPEEESSN